VPLFFLLPPPLLQMMLLLPRLLLLLLLSDFPSMSHFEQVRAKQTAQGFESMLIDAWLEKTCSM
jgi:hypothetical protein